MSLWVQKGKPVWLIFIAFIVVSNFMLYKTTIGAQLLPDEKFGVVAGSLIDLIIVLPILLMLVRQKFSMKFAISAMAVSCILVRFLIPAAYLGNFTVVTWAGIALEAGIVCIELLFIVTLVRYMPSIIKDVRGSSLPTLFAFAQSVEQRVKRNFLIQVLCAELLMAYYAVVSWKKPIQQSGMTLYKNSSYIAFQVMMIHAIVIETIGIHYWLHSKAPIVSIILLLLNVYSIVFFLGDMQALRHNPTIVKDGALYISTGLMKRAKIDFANVAQLITDKEQLMQKRKKDTADFVIRDFEPVHPSVILKMKQPQVVTMMMGFEKTYNYVAIKVDDPALLLQLLREQIGEGEMPDDINN